jgi:hypothetical protein
MKLQPMVWTVLLACSLWPTAARAQFSCGSTGADGAFVAPAGQTTTLSVPNNGVFNFTSVTISGSLKFTKNVQFNPPVIILASGDIVINGGSGVDLDATIGTNVAGGSGGPGGFDGGAPGIAGGQPGSGLGPGAGGPGLSPEVPGNAGYGGVSQFKRAKDGTTYGSPLLIPAVGGSGGGGDEGAGGGGGGGAILLCSSTQVVINGQLRANGGLSARGFGASSGVGSGGAIRLLAPVVRGTGSVDVSTPGSWAGHGRIRVDLIDRSGLTLTFTPDTALSVGSLMAVFPSTVPRLDITQVAANSIPPGTPSPLAFTLPFNSPTTQPITVRATGFTGTVPIAVVLTPDSGERIVINAEINADVSPAEVTVNANFPQNVTVRVHAWSR